MNTGQRLVDHVKRTIYAPNIALMGPNWKLMRKVEQANVRGGADAVMAYNPGTGFATEFGTGLGYTNLPAVLGPPSRLTPGQFGGPVDPFAPPYLREQLLSMGAGGSLTIQFDSPITNDSRHPFGLDFIIFGSAGFVITNGNFSGGGVTDGTLFGASSGNTRVFVSADNLQYFQLDPARAPRVDGLFPTDGAGDFSQPVNPALTPAAFAALDLAGIRKLYGDRKSTRLNSSHSAKSRMPSSA